MRKSHKIISGSILVGIAFLICVPFLISYDTRIKVASNLAIPSSNFINKYQLKNVEIQLSAADERHFFKLFENYQGEGLGVANTQFLTYYSKNNSWRDCSITINEVHFDVKIKSHGRTPYAHKFGEHFSFNIKFNNRNNPFHQRKVNFVIYNRNQLRTPINALVAQKLQLPTSDYELASVKLGNRKPYLYFTEERLNASYFQRRGLPLVILNKGVDGSFVYNGEQNLVELEKQIGNYISQQSKWSTDLKKRLFKQYQLLNQAIRQKETSALILLVDTCQLTKVNAFRLIIGANGHGFNGNNFQMAFDTLTNLFYPLVHRDNFGKLALIKADPFLQLDKGEWPNPFFIAINQDESIRITSLSIAHTVCGIKNPSLTTQIQDTVAKFQSSHIFESIAINNKCDGKNILKNIQFLRDSTIK